MSVSNEVLLDVQGLEKAYGGNQVLNGITTQIRRGEVVAIIGPSGCGKSTFLRSLNLLEEPTGGKILFEGTDITDSKVDINRHRQKIGMVFQQFNLFPHKTVKENIMLRNAITLQFCVLPVQALDFSLFNTYISYFRNPGFILHIYE